MTNYFIVGLITAFVIMLVQFYVNGLKAFRVTDAARKDAIAVFVVVVIIVLTWPAWWAVYAWGAYIDAKKKWFGDFK